MVVNFQIFHCGVFIVVNLSNWFSHFGEDF